MRRVRTYLIGTVIIGATILAAACATDTTTQPAKPATVRTSPSPLGHFTGNLAAADYAANVTFTINPGADAYIQIGPHFLYIPANTVCDPSTSGYGVDAWGLTCSTITAPLTVNATASLVNGHPLVQFDLHLRFIPSTSAQTDVMLYIRDDNASAASKIKWCPESGSLCTDEGNVATGAELNTQFDPTGLYVYRKIQHFSGYISSGNDGCDPTTDPSCGGSGY